MTHLTTTLTAGSQGRLTVDSISNIGPHYARTLREWRKRFCDAFGHDIRDSLQVDATCSKDRDDSEEIEERKEKNERLRKALREGRPAGTEMDEDELDEEAIEVFRRKWICKSRSGLLLEERGTNDSLCRLLVRFNRALTFTTMSLT